MFNKVKRIEFRCRRICYSHETCQIEACKIGVIFEDSIAEALF